MIMIIDTMMMIDILYAYRDIFEVSEIGYRLYDFGMMILKADGLLKLLHEKITISLDQSKVEFDIHFKLNQVKSS